MILNLAGYMTTLPLSVNERGMINKDKIKRILKTDYARISRHIKLLSVINKDKKFLEFIVKVPSEVFLEKLSYDVVISVDISKGLNITNNSDIKVYSNSPNFLFTFAYVYHQESFIPEEYLVNVGKVALSQAPTTTNPKRILGVDKSIWFAINYLASTGKFKNLPKTDKVNVNLISPLQNNKVLVKSSEDKLNEYNLVKKQNIDIYNKYKKMVAEDTAFSI